MCGRRSAEAACPPSAQMLGLADERITSAAQYHSAAFAGSYVFEPSTRSYDRLAAIGKGDRGSVRIPRGMPKSNMLSSLFINLLT